MGKAPDVVHARQAAQDVSTAAQNSPDASATQGPSTAKATEAFTKYIITDMYAKAVQGMKAEDAVKWADGELKKIYET